MPAIETIERQWDGSPSRFTDSEYAKASVLDRNDCQDASDMPAKQRYSLPVANPGSSWSENPDRGGVAAAAQRIGQVSAGAACKRAAARRLIRAYGKFDDLEPPDSVKQLAGQSTNARPPRDGLIRARSEMEFRAAEDDEGPVLAGHFAVFDEWTEIHSIFEGDFLERIAPGAFRKTFKEQRNEMRVLFQHGLDRQVGDKPLGPIEVLEEDERGARYEVPLIDTSYNRDLLPGLEAGLYGSSFRFRVIREEFNEEPERSDANPEGLPERTIKEAQVFEFGPVTFPAYANATAGVRSLTDQFIFEQFTRDPERLRELLEALPREKPEEDEKQNGAGDKPHSVQVANPIPVRLWRLGRKEEAWKLP